MSVRHTSLFSPEGELFSVRVSVEPRLLETLLETLATLPFPLNPQLYHGTPTAVEFPAYASQLAALRKQLERAGVDAVIARPMLSAITAA